MKVICEKYNGKDEDCEECCHSKLHDLDADICQDDFICGICSTKPFKEQRKFKLEKINETSSRIKSHN